MVNDHMIQPYSLQCNIRDRSNSNIATDCYQGNVSDI